MAKTPVKKNELDLFVEEKGLAEIFPNYKTFEPFLIQANEWRKKGLLLKVTGLEQTTQMAQAREGRLFMRNVRIKIEDTRKRLKENSLKEGQAIDKLAGFLKDLIEPIETHLGEQEKFIERLQEAKKQEIKTKREELLKPYHEDTSFFDLLNMPEDNFVNLLENSKLAYESKIENDRKIEEERVLLLRTTTRIAELHALGFKSNGLGEYVHRFPIKTIEDIIKDRTDQQWDAVIKDFAAIVKVHEENEAKEKSRLEEENKKANLALEELQKRKDRGVYRLEEIQRIGFVAGFDSLADMTNEEWNSYFGGLKQQWNLLQEEKKKEDLAIKARNNKRSEELKPYIIFIRDYSKTLNLIDSDYEKELSDLKIAAEQHYEHERKKQIEAARIEEENREKAAAEKAAEEKLAAIELENAKGDKQRFEDYRLFIENLRDSHGVEKYKSQKHKKLSIEVATLLTKIVNHINLKI